MRCLIISGGAVRNDLATSFYGCDMWRYRRDMRNVRRMFAGTCAMGIFVLTGCQAVHPSAIRVNFDGSIDYVTCAAEADNWLAYSTDEKKEDTDLPYISEPGPASAGSIVNFRRPEGEWVSIHIGASFHSNVRVDSDDVSLGVWRWNTDGDWLTNADRARCSVDE